MSASDAPGSPVSAPRSTLRPKLISIGAILLFSLMAVGAISSMFGSKDLPNALSCSTNDYPSAFDKGMLAFGDLGHDGVQSAGIVATEPLTDRSYLGTSSVDKTDRVLTLQGLVNPDGTTDVISGTMRLHLVSSEGADRYKLALTLADGKAPTHWLCLGPIAQKQYAQEFHATQATSPAPSVPHIKAGGYICDQSFEVMGEAQLRDKDTPIAFQGCQQVGADVEVNVLGRDPHYNGVIHVGNSGGVAWVDQRDLVQ